MARKDTCLAVLAGEKTTRFVHPEDCVMLFTPGERNMGERSSRMAPQSVWTGLGAAGRSLPIPARSTVPQSPRAPSGWMIWPISGRPFPTAEQVHAFDWAGYAKRNSGGGRPGGAAGDDPQHDRPL